MKEKQVEKTYDIIHLQMEERELRKDSTYTQEKARGVRSAH